MFEQLSIEGVVLVTPRHFADERGFFEETFRANQYEEGGVFGPFVQDNHSLSEEPFTLRGLHFQTSPHPQAKLVRCTQGAIFDVAVDLRHGSETFGQSVSAILSAVNRKQLFVPIGFAHGFLTLEANCEVQYKVSDYYVPDCDHGLAWDDPDLKIDWPLDNRLPVLSDKDRQQPNLRDLPTSFL